jgi:hypothetical protein
MLQQRTAHRFVFYKCKRGINHPLQFYSPYRRGAHLCAFPLTDKSCPERQLSGPSPHYGTSRQVSHLNHRSLRTIHSLSPFA